MLLTGKVQKQKCHLSLFLKVNISANGEMGNLRQRKCQDESEGRLWNWISGVQIAMQVNMLALKLSKEGLVKYKWNNLDLILEEQRTTNL